MKFLKKCLKLGVVAATSFALTACFEHHVTVNVNPDGSGTIEEQIVLGAQIAAMMAAEGGPLPMMDEANYKTKAGQMGEGVEFVSVEEINLEDGSKGAKATFTFTDVSKLKLEAMSQPALEDIEEVDEDAEFFAFEFEGGSPATLTINMPAPDAEALEELQGNGNGIGAAEKAQMQQMAAMMQGMRMLVQVKVNGEISETNATHVEDSTITIYDVDMGKLFSSPEVLAAISDPDELDNFTKLKALMSKVEGLKVEEKEKVTVSFE